MKEVQLSKQDLVERILDRKRRLFCLFLWRKNPICSKEMSGRFFTLSSGNIYEACERHLQEYLNRVNASVNSWYSPKYSPKKENR